MMPMTHGLTYFNQSDATQTSPELRRMEIHSRARREELDTMLNHLSPRQTVAYGRSTRGSNPSSFITKFINGLRDGIGTALISAGNRIQSPA